MKHMFTLSIFQSRRCQTQILFYVMGNMIIKSNKTDATLLVTRISTKMLAYSQPKKNPSKSPLFIANDVKSNSNTYKLPNLSVSLSRSLLKHSNNELKCSQRDVEQLRSYLGGELNLVKHTVSHPRSFLTYSKRKSKSELNKLRQQLDREIVQILDAEKYPHKILSANGQKHLISILRELDSTIVRQYYSPFFLFFRFRASMRPHLLSTVILPKLEEVYRTNNERSKSYNTIVMYKVREKANELRNVFVSTFFRQQISASNLRKSLPPNGRLGESCVAGMDRAHKLSLYLAVHLWKIVYGHDLAYANVRLQLRQALSLRENIYLTCIHTNRTLHVKYDVEIVKALHKKSEKTQTENPRVKLSPGAKMRVGQVIEVLLKLKDHSFVMKDFSEHSLTRLKNLI